MIQFMNVTIRAGQFALENISLEIPSGCYAVLMGQTGQGKTTILETICGLRGVTSGRILIGGVDMTDWSPSDRGIGYVPQDLALFTTMTVKEHLAFALQLRKQPQAFIRNRTDELANLLGIAPLMDRRIKNLSGGERQRVAIGRALSFHPNVLLLDEPFSALDRSTRKEMYSLVQQLKQTIGVTTIHVTHNEEDAETLADRFYTIDHGKLRITEIKERTLISG